jgi:hypothetical protein
LIYIQLWGFAYGQLIRNLYFTRGEARE